MPSYVESRLRSIERRLAGNQCTVADLDLVWLLRVARAAEEHVRATNDCSDHDYPFPFELEEVLRSP